MTYGHADWFALQGGGRQCEQYCLWLLASGWFCFKQGSQLNLYRPWGFYLPTRIRIDDNFSPVPRSESNVSRMMPVDSRDRNCDGLEFSDPFCVHSDNNTFASLFSNGQQLDPQSTVQQADSLGCQEFYRKCGKGLGGGGLKAFSSWSLLISCISTLYNMILFCMFW